MLYVLSLPGNQIELPPGAHTYSFACALPAMLPTSFEGTYGHIRYTVRVVLERPWKFDQSYKVAFTVLKEFDLNYDSPILRVKEIHHILGPSMYYNSHLIIKIPTQMEITKSFWCGPCTTGPLSMMSSIPQSGYVPGQKVIITTEVTNMSNIPVDQMKFMLRKIISYNSQTPTTKTKTEIVVIQERRTDGVLTKNHGRFQVVLPIPPEPPSNINLCKVIHITYEVKVEAKISGPHHSPFIKIPITVGTVPLNRFTPDPKTPLIRTHVGFIEPVTAQPSFSIAVPIPENYTAAAPTILTGRETMPPSYPGQSGINTVQPITDALANRNAAEYPDMRMFPTVTHTITSLTIFLITKRHHLTRNRCMATDRSRTPKTNTRLGINLIRHVIQCTILTSQRWYQVLLSKACTKTKLCRLLKIGTIRCFMWNIYIYIYTRTNIRHTDLKFFGG